MPKCRQIRKRRDVTTFPDLTSFTPLLFLSMYCFKTTQRFMRFWPHPYSTLILGCSRCTRSPMLDVNERMGLKGREIIFEEFQPMWSRYLIVTDRRTDGQTDRQTDGRLTVASPRSALASRGRNKKNTQRPDRVGSPGQNPSGQVGSGFGSKILTLFHLW